MSRRSEQSTARTDLPGPIPALLRSLRLAFHAEPWLFTASFVLAATAWIPTAVIALWLKMLADGAVAHNSTKIAAAAGGLAGSVALGWLLTTLSGRVGQLFRSRTTVALSAHVAELQGKVVSIEHHERPEYLDRLQLLKDHVFLLDHLYAAFMGIVGLALMLAITIGLLASVNPILMVLALFALPAAASGSWRAGAERAAQDQAAPDMRLSRHLYELGTLAGSGKELRVTRTGELLIQRRRTAWGSSFAIRRGARWTSAWLYAAAWAFFGLAYFAAIAVVALVLHGSAGSLLLVLAAGGGLARYLGVTLGTAQFLRWTLDATARMAWLEDFASEHQDTADAAVPDRIAHRIRFEGVSFRYPGTERLVLQGVDLELPAGSVVAVVGENGAGKTTLVKLLCRFYEPSAGRITIDGTSLNRIPAVAWRKRIAGAFQDFMRFEFQARRTVGVGDLPREEQDPAVETAIARGGATDVVERLPAGLDTQLGPTWDDGVELSFGQWQKLALARGFMRDDPLLLVLDEPTAALDAETEHALFERFAAQSRAQGSAGRITILVSHRFSTVRMADLILVLDGSRVVELGSHDGLMSRGGLYAELYRIQARAYR
jgi:ATP-binding cassette subfamily B protein